MGNTFSVPGVELRLFVASALPALGFFFFNSLLPVVWFLPTGSGWGGLAEMCCSPGCVGDCRRGAAVGWAVAPGSRPEGLQIGRSRRGIGN